MRIYAKRASNFTYSRCAVFHPPRIDSESTSEPIIKDQTGSVVCKKSSFYLSPSCELTPKAEGGPLLELSWPLPPPH